MSKPYSKSKTKKNKVKINRNSTDPNYWNEILRKQGLGVTKVEKGM